jgi:hypothetical protein
MHANLVPHLLRPVYPLLLLNTISVNEISSDGIASLIEQFETSRQTIFHFQLIDIHTQGVILL